MGAENYWGKDAIEVRFADCGHSMFIPLGHSPDHERCYACHPKLAKEPIPGYCPEFLTSLVSMAAKR
jgi:hypothetical protein